MLAQYVAHVEASWPGLGHMLAQSRIPGSLENACAVFRAARKIQNAFPGSPENMQPRPFEHDSTAIPVTSPSKEDPVQLLCCGCLGGSLQ